MFIFTSGLKIEKKKIFQANGFKKQAGAAISIFEKIDFKQKLVSEEVG